MPEIGPNDALIRITTTTICGTDVHPKGEYPVERGLTIGHEPSADRGEASAGNVIGYTEGQRVIAGAISPLPATAMPASTGCIPRTGRARRTGSTPGRLALRQHHRRCAGRVPWSCPTPWPTSPPCRTATERRAGADVPGHHVDRLRRCRGRQHQDRRHGGCLRARPDRPRATAGAVLRATTIIAVGLVPERLAMAKRLGADAVADFGGRRGGRDHGAGRTPRRPMPRSRRSAFSRPSRAA
ncbi:MAG: alcohol dehydrogenase catalytic domain-containing protein [Geminicoccaceae bacterium]